MLNWLAADTPRAPQEPAQQQMQTRARSTDASLDATMAEITHRLELERQLRSRSAEPTMEAAMAPKFLFRSAETGRLATVAIILTTFPVPFKARARAAYIAASQGHREIVELLTTSGTATPNILDHVSHIFPQARHRPNRRSHALLVPMLIGC